MIPTHKYRRYQKSKLIKMGMVIFPLFFIILLLNTQVGLATPKAKSLFSRPKWMKKKSLEEKASPKASLEKVAAKNFFYPSQIKISQELGKIQESYQGKKKKLIIHLQDAHCNYDGQKKAAHLLEELVKNYGLRLILVEGGSGDVSLAYLRDYGTQELREKVAEEYLKKGEIAGEEYLDIVSDLQFILYGIETDELYNAHLDSFWKVEVFKDRALKNCSDLKTLVDKLKKYVYSKQLKALEQKKADYEKEKITIVDYYEYLESLGKKFDIALASFPNFKRFVGAAQFEKNIKTDEITADSKKLVEKLVEILPEKKLKQLLAKSAKFKLKKIESSDYYLFLKMLSLNNHLSLNSYPNLYSYLNYLESSEKIDAPRLIKEVKTVEEVIKEKLFRNNEERDLNEISENLDLLINFINLQLTPAEYEVYSHNKSNFRPTAWVKFLNTEARQHKLKEQIIDTSLIENNLEKVEAYYQAAIKRDVAMLENSINKMNQDGEAIAVLITGGFHTPRLSRMIKEKDYSYLVIAPKITKTSDHNFYISVLKNRQPLGKSEK